MWGASLRRDGACFEVDRDPDGLVPGDQAVPSDTDETVARAVVAGTPG
jgi:hypothetical protein